MRRPSPRGEAEINQCPPGRRRDDPRARRLAGPAASAAESGVRRRDRRRGSPGSTRRAASAAPNALLPVRSTRSWAHPNSCTPCSSNAARAANCASPPCPVDCIEMRPRIRMPARDDARSNRARYEAHSARLQGRARGDAQRETRGEKGRGARRSRAAGAHVNPAKRRADLRATCGRRTRRRAPNCTYRTPFELLVAVILSAQATDKSVNKATAALLRRRKHAGRDPRAGRRGTHSVHQVDRALQQQGKEHHRNLRGAAVAARWRGAAQPRGARGTAGRRAQDRQRGDEHGFRRADHGGRHAHFSRRQPDRTRTGQERARRGGQADEIRAGRISARMRITG